MYLNATQIVHTIADVFISVLRTSSLNSEVFGIVFGERLLILWSYCFLPSDYTILRMSHAQTHSHILGNKTHGKSKIVTRKEKQNMNICKCGEQERSNKKASSPTPRKGSSSILQFKHIKNNPAVAFYWWNDKTWQNLGG